MLITEFCSHGDLLNFLRRKAPSFSSSVFHTHKLSNIYRNLIEQQNHENCHEISRHDFIITQPVTQLITQPVTQLITPQKC